MYDRDYVLEGWIENELRKKIFPNYVPTDRKEIEYDELAEVLTDVKHILDRDGDFMTVNSATIRVLRMLKELGILQGNQINNVYQLYIIKWDKLTQQAEVKKKEIFFIIDDVEKIYDKMQDLDFVSRLPLTENNYFEKFALTQVNI